MFPFSAREEQGAKPRVWRGCSEEREKEEAKETLKLISKCNSVTIEKHIDHGKCVQIRMKQQMKRRQRQGKEAKKNSKRNKR